MSATSGLDPMTSFDPLDPDLSRTWTTSRASAARTLTAPPTASETPETSPSAPATANRTTSDCCIASGARTASPNARARRCSTAICPTTRPTPSSSTSTRAAASAPPDASSVSIATPLVDWPAGPDNTPTTLTPSSWLFPPRTREVQFDEKWSFVAKKQKNCDPLNPGDDHKGEWWDHVAYDPEHRLVLAVVPGARVTENAVEVVQEVKDRTAATPELMTSDAYAAYEAALGQVYGALEVPARAEGPGRPARLQVQVPPGVTYATVQKERAQGRVVAVVTAVVLGMFTAVAGALERSQVSSTINTSFVERSHATDRGRNARKARKTYRFSKDWCVHEAMTYFTLYSYNFCWVVRTLRERHEDGRWQHRTPAMAAGLADHVWSLEEWVTFPAVQRK